MTQHAFLAISGAACVGAIGRNLFTKPISRHTDPVDIYRILTRNDCSLRVTARRVSTIVSLTYVTVRLR